MVTGTKPKLLMQGTLSRHLARDLPGLNPGAEDSNELHVYLCLCTARPAVARRHYHPDPWNGHDVTALREPGVRPRGGRLRYPEPLCQGNPRRNRPPGFPGARADLALDNPGHLEIARDTGVVIKIIGHLASLDA